MEALIFAAGFGTRMKPITDSIPKALVTIKDKTLLEILIQKLINSGFNHIVINVHYLSDKMIEFLNSHPFDADIFISQEEELLDTGGGLKNAQQYFSGKHPILIHNVDVLSNLDLNDIYTLHIKNKSIASLAVSNRNTSRYFLFDKQLNLKGWKNKSTNETKYAGDQKEGLTELAFSGIQVISPDIFDILPGKKIFSITDAYLEIAKTHPIKGYVHQAKDWLDVGKPEMIPVAENFLFH